MVKLAKAGDFCPNQGCPDYEKLQSASQHNVIKAGKTKAGVQRHEYTTCHRTFTATKGTLFYGKCTSAETILENLAFLAEGNRTSCEVEFGITSLSRKKITPDRLLCFRRKHWGIEIGLHYRRDVTFKEDATRMSIGNYWQSHGFHQSCGAIDREKVNLAAW
jgi:hypothetical protein